MIAVTDALLGEHGAIYPLLAHLEQASFASPGEARTAAALLQAALATHAHLEDELLFARLEERLGTQAGPLAVMRLEHDEIEGVLGRLVETEGVIEAKALAGRLGELARAHFAKEEQVLFPLAGEILGEERLRELGEEWARRRLSV